MIGSFLKRTSLNSEVSLYTSKKTDYTEQSLLKVFGSHETGLRGEIGMESSLLESVQSGAIKSLGSLENWSWEVLKERMPSNNSQEFRTQWRTSKLLSLF